MKKIILSLIFLFSSLSVVIGQTYTMTNGSNNSYNTCSGTFVDSGGTGAAYGNDESSVITFCPLTPGDFIQVNFTQFETEDSFSGAFVYDFLSYWNANTNAGPADNELGGDLGAFSITSTSPDGCITFEFYSDSGVTELGWEATISCITPCTVPIANLDSTPVDICGPSATSPGSLIVAFDASGSTANAPETVASYEWDFGDGTPVVSTPTSTTTHTYPSSEGVYLASVSVIDSNGCQSTNAETRVIRVFPGPDYSGTPSTYSVNCGDSLSLTGVVSSQTETQSTPVITPAITELPDGSGVSYSSTLDFTGLFPTSGPGSTITPGCYPILTFELEHSWSPDLQIELVAPTGETVMVFDQHDSADPGFFTMFGTCVNESSLNPIVPGCVAPYTVVGDGSGVDWTAGGNTTTVTTNCGVYAGACEPGAYYLPTTYNSTNPFTVFNKPKFGSVDINV
jgi:hypothetical protein